MALSTWESLDLLWGIVRVVAVIGGVVTAVRYFKGGISWTLAWSRKRDLARLQRRRTYLTRLKECDRAYYGRLLSGMLWVLALLGLEMALQGAGANTPHGPHVTAAVRSSV